MSMRPCLNPNCHSHGQPHPNCRCYGGFAEGGEVEAFCARPRMHQPGCEYFADGGDVWETEYTAPYSDDPVTPASPYDTPMQQALTGLEGAAQGFLGPVATGVEKLLSKAGVPGLEDQDIAGRQQTHPITHGVAEGVALVGSAFVPGLGEYSLASKAMRVAESAAAVAKMGKMGSNILKGALQGGLLQGSDEISKAMVGMGNPEAPVAGALANIGAAGLFGAVGGGLFGGSAAALEKLGNAKAGTKIAANVDQFLAGIGAASQRTESIPGAAPTAAFKAGHKFFGEAVDKIGQAANTGIAGAAGHLMGYGMLESALLGRGIVPNLISKQLTKQAEKYTLPVIMRLMTNAEGTNLPSKLYSALNYANNANSGLQRLNRGVESLFGAGARQAIDATANVRDREVLRKYIENGGINQAISAQATAAPNTIAEPAEGAPLFAADDPVAAYFPEQNVLLSTAKGRISNYLLALKPAISPPTLAFDAAPPTAQAQKTFENALDVAVDPLSVLGHVGQGTLLPEHVQHLQSMFPEVHRLMQQQLTEQITKAQLAGKPPPYQVRQGMSMLVGAPLDGVLTPASIVAAQAGFVAKKAQQQAPPSPKRTEHLGKIGAGYMTGDQARQARQNKV